MKKAAVELKKDAEKYEKKMKKAPSAKVKMHEKVEMKEAKSAAKDMAKRSKKAHEY